MTSETLAPPAAPAAATVTAGFLLLLFCLGAALLIDQLIQVKPQTPRWRRGLQRLQWRPFAPVHAGLLVGGVTAAFFLVTAGLRPFFPEFFERAADPQTMGLEHMLYSVALLHGVALVLVLLLLRGPDRSWRSCFEPPPPEAASVGWPAVRFYLMTLAPTLLVGFAINVVYVYLTHSMPEPQAPFEVLSRSQGCFPVAVMVFIAVVVAPVVEELVFRGVVMPVLSQRLGASSGILISSVGFAAIHGHWVSFAPLLVLSVGLSLVYIFTSSIRSAMIMHALFNGVMLAIHLVQSHAAG